MAPPCDPYADDEQYEEPDLSELQRYPAGPSQDLMCGDCLCCTEQQCWEKKCPEDHLEHSTCPCTCD